MLWKYIKVCEYIDLSFNKTLSIMSTLKIGFVTHPSSAPSLTNLSLVLSDLLSDVLVLEDDNDASLAFSNSGSTSSNHTSGELIIQTSK